MSAWYVVAEKEGEETVIDGQWEELNIAMYQSRAKADEAAAPDTSVYLKADGFPQYWYWVSFEGEPDRGHWKLANPKPQPDGSTPPQQ